MVVNRRREIVNFLVSELKSINGGVSPYDPTYTFNLDIFSNVFRNIKFIDEVNDFPSLYLAAGTEIRNFESQYLTEATLTVMIRSYVYGEDNSHTISDKLLQDIEHVIYTIGDHPDKGILDITIDNITTDEGLVTPYGIIEIELSVVYRLEN